VLLEFFIKLFSDRQNLAAIQLPQAHAAKLAQYDWPGNVRQLRNYAERLVMNCSLRCSRDVVDVLYRELVQQVPAAPDPAPPPLSPSALRERLKASALENEKGMIMEALTKARYRKNLAAQALGVSRTTLWRKIKEFDIE